MIRLPPKSTQSRSSAVSNVYKSQVLGLVLVHRDLLEHDLALGVDLRVGGPEEHLGQELEGAIRVNVEEPRVKLRRLLARRGVHRRAQAVEDLGDVGGGMALG